MVKGDKKKKAKIQTHTRTHTHTHTHTHTLLHTLTPNPQTSRASCLWTERGSVSFLARLAGAFSKAHRPPLPEEAAAAQSQQRLLFSSSPSHSCLSLCLLAPSWGRTRWGGQHLLLWPSCRHSSQLQVRLDVSMERNFQKPFVHMRVGWREIAETWRRANVSFKSCPPQSNGQLDREGSVSVETSASSWPSWKLASSQQLENRPVWSVDFSSDERREKSLRWGRMRRNWGRTWVDKRRGRT